MPHYLVAKFLPDDFDPSTITESMMGDPRLNREMIAAGVRKSACGISPPGDAKTVRKEPDGKVHITDGPYIETKEHMGGFWILECADLEEARKGAISCDAGGRGTRASFLPGSGTRIGRKQVNKLMIAAPEAAL